MSGWDQRVGGLCAVQLGPAADTQSAHHGLPTTWQQETARSIAGQLVMLNVQTQLSKPLIAVLASCALPHRVPAGDLYRSLTTGLQHS